MKVLFIFKSENFLAPIGLCAISAIARQQGHETYLCEINSQNPLEAIAHLKPEIIAYSSSTGESKHYLKLNSAIKKEHPGVFTIMGGPHPTFYPEVIKEGSLDAVCIGEGELAFAELLSARLSQKPVANIPNIVTLENINNNSVRDLIDDLDSLPFPDYALLYDNTPMGSYPLKSIISSRGCPYDCTYCFNHAWRKIYAGKGKAVRRHSVDYVIDELKYIKSRWPLSCVKFYDDIFTYKADQWLEDFSKKYKKEIGLPFFILTRADLLTEDMVKLLKSAGCRTISMSIEAGNPEIRRKILGRDMSDEQIIKAHQLCNKYRIYTFTNFIIGIPGATIKDEVKSIDLAIKSKITWAEFLIFHPYPGTTLGEETIRKGLYTPAYQEMHTSYMYRTPLNCFSDKEINVQMNLTALGGIAVVFPALRGLIVHCLIKIKHNSIFTIFYYIVKTYIFRRKIYVTKTSVITSLAILLKGLKQEWFRHENRAG
jgi:anaerobic magnesium-protoporphyrin IX monomethyl ester cyclase